MERKGFTLIELMVVILIVALLAAVAIPILRGRIEEAKWAEGKAIMGSVATAIQAYAAEKGYNADPPTTFFEIGFENEDLAGTYFNPGDFDFVVRDMGSADGSTVLDFDVTCEGSTKDIGPTRPDGGYALRTDGVGGLEFVLLGAPGG
jgi:prepilin-type N-terminal cleavage/methylation domain-containing protein